MKEVIDEGQFWNRGVPVGPDVELLIKELGLPEPGLIEHTRVEKILGLRKGDNRYRTVTWAWRERLWNEHNIRVVGVNGGFEVIVGEDRIEQAERQRNKAKRRIMQSVKEAITTPEQELDATGKRRRDHLILSGARLASAHSTAQIEYREVLKQLPESLPKREPPQ